MNDRVKSKKNTVVKSKPEKEYHHPYQYWNAFEQSAMGLPVGKQMDIAQELFNCATDPQEFTLLGALVKMRIPRPTFQVWLKKYPIIADAYEEAKAIITSKRFNAAATKQASEKLFNFVPQYCQEYQDYAKWIESIKAAKEADKPTQVNIVMTDFKKLSHDDIAPQDTNEKTEL